MRRIVLALAALGTTATGGCVGVAGLMGAHMNAYEGKELPIEQVAVLVGDRARMTKVDDHRVGDSMLGYPSEVRILPGDHRVILDCISTVNQTVSADFLGHFEAGHRYQLFCIYQGDGRFVIDMNDVSNGVSREQKS